MISYDNVGRPTIYKDQSMKWNGFDQLIQVGDQIQYAYDVNGIRKKKVVNGVTTEFITNGSQILSMKHGVATFIFRYVLNKLVGFNYNDNVTSKEYLYQRNIQGDIIGIYDDEGNQVGEYAYDGYGNQVIVKDEGGIASLNPFRYRGYYFDEETQLYWVSSRYYSPELCRWISPDSIEYLDPESINGLNLYCYCFNNPVNYVDPDGHMPFLCALLILGAIGMVANVGSQALTDLAYGNEFKWENYLVAAGAGFLGGMCYAIPGVGSIVSAAVTSGLTTAGQMAVSGEDYDGWDYLIMAGGSAVLSGLTAWGFGKLSNNMAFFKDSNFILDNFTKFATNYGGITLKPTVILQAAGQIAIRETVAGFVGAPLSGIPGYFDRVYRLNKLGLSPADSFRYAF